MKSCPTCHRTFEDTMSFCLVDGAILSAPFNPGAGSAEPETNSSIPPPTVRYPALDLGESSHGAPPERTAPETALPETGYLQSGVPTVLPKQPVAPTSPSAGREAMKTIAAPPPDMANQHNANPGRPTPRPTQAASPVYQTVASESGLRTSKSARYFVMGAVVIAIVLSAGVFFFIRHNKAANLVATNSPAVKTAEKKSGLPAGPLVESVNGSNLDMVYVKGGTFLMGSPASDPDRDQDEGPQAEVTVANFHLSKYEVTQAQYRAVMNTNPSRIKGDALPVDGVAWGEAVEYCRKLSQLTGRHYRLPTEAEWEYAARAGVSGSFAGKVDALAWYDANSGGHPHPVGQKDGNAFGLYDMNGNLWEWCQSKYKPYPYSAVDGREDLEGSDVRVLRGGSFESAARGCRASYRRRVTPHPQATGFRVVLAPQ